MKPWKVIAFHTDDDLYNEQIYNLVVSLREFKLPFDIKTVPNHGSWKKNTMAMSGYILDALFKHDENLVFLDADAVVRQYPELFDTIEEDFACHYKDGKELLAGTMYFKNCDKVRRFVADWQICSNRRTDHLSAQTGISDALLWNKDLSVYKLPAPYTLIFDSMKHQGPPVIEHFQASRMAKH